MILLLAITNFLRWGAEFLYRDTASYIDENLLIGYTGQEMQSIRGSLLSSAPLLDANKVKITAERFVFLIDTVLLNATGVIVQRGVEIIKDNITYQVVLDPKGVKQFNDPSQLRTAITCTKKEVTI